MIQWNLPAYEVTKPIPSIKLSLWDLLRIVVGMSDDVKTEFVAEILCGSSSEVCNSIHAFLDRVEAEEKELKNER